MLEERGVIGPSEQGGRSREVLDGVNGNGSDRRDSVSEGRTMADEAAEIIAEEKAREEFLKKQGAVGKLPPHGLSNGAAKEDEMSSN